MKKFIKGTFFFVASVLLTAKPLYGEKKLGKMFGERKLAQMIQDVKALKLAPEKEKKVLSKIDEFKEKNNRKDFSEKMKAYMEAVKNYDSKADDLHHLQQELAALMATNGANHLDHMLSIKEILSKEEWAKFTAIMDRRHMRRGKFAEEGDMPGMMP